MARDKVNANGAAEDPGNNKSRAVAILIREKEDISIPEIVEGLKKRWGMTIDPHMASSYRYSIKRRLGMKINRRGRKRRGGAPAAPKAAVVSESTPPRPVTGYDDLFAAAKKLGWARVKEFVENVTQAPDFRGR